MLTVLQTAASPFRYFLYSFKPSLPLAPPSHPPPPPPLGEKGGRRKIKGKEMGGGGVGGEEGKKIKPIEFRQIRFGLRILLQSTLNMQDITQDQLFQLRQT